MKAAHRQVAREMGQHGSLAHDYPKRDWKIAKIKLKKKGQKSVNGRRLYDITFEQKKRRAKKGYAFK